MKISIRYANNTEVLGSIMARMLKTLVSHLVFQVEFGHLPLFRSFPLDDLDGYFSAVPSTLVDDTKATTPKLISL